jgi:hypothetical protein
MMCNMKTMLKVGAGMLVAAGTAYLLLPQFREMIVALAPTLLFLLCPLSMLFCMKMMQGQNGQACDSSTGKENGKRASAQVAAEEKAS